MATPQTLRIQSMQGFMYGVLAASTGGDGQQLTFSPDQIYQLQEVRFFALSAGAIDLETIRIEANGESVYGGNYVPLGILQSVLAANNNAAGNQGLVVWRPEVPIEISRDRPLRLTAPGTAASFAIGVAIHAISLGAEARA